MAGTTKSSVSYLICLMASFLVVTGACNAIVSPQSQIVGKWQEVNGTEIVQFYGDSTYDSWNVFGIISSGNYSFPDKQHLRLTPKSGLFQTETTFAVTISAGRLTVTTLNGEATEYQRVQ